MMMIISHLELELCDVVDQAADDDPARFGRVVRAHFVNDDVPHCIVGDLQEYNDDVCFFFVFFFLLIVDEKKRIQIDQLIFKWPNGAIDSKSHPIEMSCTY